MPHVRRCCLMVLASLLVLLATEEKGVMAAPAWQCAVCEDAVQTWHDQFRCAGELLEMDSPFDKHFQGCRGPRLICKKLTGKLKETCMTMHKELRTDPKLKRDLWETMIKTMDAYSTCVALKKCPQDGASGETAVEPEEKAENPMAGFSPCHRTLESKTCGTNITCTNYTKTCDEMCWTCYWLVKDWPLFQEMCKPEGAGVDPSFPQPGDVIGGSGGGSSGSFLQLTQRPTQLDLAEGPTVQDDDDPGKLMRLRERMQRVNRRALMQARQGTSDGEKTVLQTGYTRDETCFALWNEIQESHKARYFTSWKRYVEILTTPMDRLQGRMWDANTVCKCLGHCKLDRFEDLGLIEACRYDAQNELAMQYVFKYEGEYA